jgi:hypothetical protein
MKIANINYAESVNIFGGLPINHAYKHPSLYGKFSTGAHRMHGPIRMGEKVISGSRLEAARKKEKQKAA